jgi:hypothetical protein
MLTAKRPLWKLARLPERSRMDVENLRFEDFSNRVGDVFTPREEPYSIVALTLDKAELMPVIESVPVTRPSFSLLFLGSGEHILPQRMYRLAHDAMGDITLFLVPVGREGRGILYQALFN